MAVASKGVDKVRASRDGHEYHEAWAARKAMQLLFPHDGLIGIAVEGLEPADQQSVSASTAEVADLTLYHGKRSTFQDSQRVTILQFKYSVAGKDRPFRAAEAKETIAKFAAAYRDHKKHHSAKTVARKLRFELITNRPAHPNFEKAVHLLANGRAGSGDCKKQMKQVRETGEPIKKNLVVKAHWEAPDGVDVSISSALVASKRAKKLIDAVLAEEPFSAVLPRHEPFDDNDTEPRKPGKDGPFPWLFSRSAEGGLDTDDTLGGLHIEQRPHFTDAIAADLSLTSADPFGRFWYQNGRPAAETQAWGYDHANAEHSKSTSGTRIVCTPALLRDVLATRRADLVVLICLRRHERGDRGGASKFSHTVAIVRVRPDLSWTFHPGTINFVHQL